MENRKEQYQGRKQNDNADIITENNLGAQSLDQDSDCWSELWQLIKTKGSRFLR